MEKLQVGQEVEVRDYATQKLIKVAVVTSNSNNQYKVDGKTYDFMMLGRGKATGTYIQAK